jgi:hypothetical protein
MRRRAPGLLLLAAGCVSGGLQAGGEDAAVAPASSMPGTPIRDPGTPGTGACAGRTLASAVAAAQALRPELADITEIFQPDGRRQDRVIQAFARDDGFALAFSRGSGDCPAGCTIREYWYFETGPGCLPREVGRYYVNREGLCTRVDGLALWQAPPPEDPGTTCGLADEPGSILGGHVLMVRGEQATCDARGVESRKPFLGRLNATVVRTDRWRGTVTLTGSGVPRLDGRAMAAVFFRRAVVAKRSTSSTPGLCSESGWAFAEFDLDQGTGQMGFSDFHPAACNASMVDCSATLYGDLAVEK